MTDLRPRPESQMESSAPRFTILLPVIRPPILLPQAVESVLAQSVAEFELFVICDGAPPETVKYAEQVARRDRRVKVFDLPKGESIGEAHLHTALTVASGTYVAHIEDDDLWFPNHLEELEKLLQTVDFGHTIFTALYPDGRIRATPSDIGTPQFRQRLLEEHFNSFGYSVCGYRLDAYRRLPEGWTPTPGGIWPDLYFWRKFLRHPDLKSGTRMMITAIAMAGHIRPDMSLVERGAESRDWLKRISDSDQRARITEAAWRSVVHWEIESDVRHLQDSTSLREARAALAQLELLHPGSLSEVGMTATAHAETQLELERMKIAYARSQEAVAAWTSELRKLQIELDRVARSKSWRFTAPFRAMLARVSSVFK